MNSEDSSFNPRTSCPVTPRSVPPGLGPERSTASSSMFSQTRVIPEFEETTNIGNANVDESGSFDNTWIQQGIDDSLLEALWDDYWLIEPSLPLH